MELICIVKFGFGVVSLYFEDKDDNVIRYDIQYLCNDVADRNIAFIRRAFTVSEIERRMKGKVINKEFVQEIPKTY